jgi:hypothetical protein
LAAGAGVVAGLLLCCSASVLLTGVGGVCWLVRVGALGWKVAWVGRIM